MSIKTFWALKESITLMTMYPSHDWTILSVAQFARITTEVILNFFRTLTCTTVFLTGKEP
jgi:hypothetical protein